MNNNDFRTTLHFVLRLTALLLLTTTISEGALYPFGTEHGDVALTFAKWELGSEQINIESPFPFLGKGTLPSVWVNTLGALTFNRLMDPRFTSLVKNIALAPFFSQSAEGAEGAVYYRQTTTDDVLLELITNDISGAALLPPSDNYDKIYDFLPTWAMQVTWSKVASTSDENLENTFQIVLASDGKRSFAIYNYANDLSWDESHGQYAAAGIFIVPDATSTCFYALPDSQTDQVTNIASRLGNNQIVGRYVFIISEPIRCVTKFESACDASLPSSDWGFSEPHFSINAEEWDVYVIHQCKEGLRIKPKVYSERIDCVYEPDYYNSAWEKDPSKCIDFNATRNFDFEIGLLQVGNDSVFWFDELMEPDTQEYEDLESVVVPAVTNILSDMGITDVVVSITNFTQGPGVRPHERSETNVSVTVGVTVHVPTFVHKKLTAEEIETAILTSLEGDDGNTGVTFVPEIVVRDTTDKCLQGCLCRNKKSDPALCRTGGRFIHIQPDSCCGGCNGKPYSQTIKACCNDQHIYDPTKATCCNGKIRKGVDNRCPKN